MQRPAATPVRPLLTRTVPVLAVVALQATPAAGAGRAPGFFVPPVARTPKRPEPESIPAGLSRPPAHGARRSQVRPAAGASACTCVHGDTPRVSIETGNYITPGGRPDPQHQLSTSVLISFSLSHRSTTTAPHRLLACFFACGNARAPIGYRDMAALDFSFGWIESTHLLSLYFFLFFSKRYKLYSL